MAKAKRPGKGRPASRAESAKEEEVVNFDYIKSNFFRVVHVDGVIGGLTPNGLINMSLWNQRAPIPDRVSHAVVEGSVGPEISREQRDAFVREVEVSLVFNLGMAQVLHRWLGKHLEEYAERVGVQEVEEEGEGADES